MLPKVRQVRMEYVKMICWHQSYTLAFPNNIKLIIVCIHISELINWYSHQHIGGYFKTGKAFFYKFLFFFV
jgi:hypothetical protein